MASSDAELVARAASGDDSAFDELVSRYRGRVYYLALSKVRAREIALDVAQDAFVQAYISLGKLREPEKFASWLMSITSNLCRMHFRRAREIAMPDEAIDALNSHRDAPESDMDATVAVEATRQAARGHPERRAPVLRRRNEAGRNRGVPGDLVTGGQVQDTGSKGTPPEGDDRDG